MTILKLLWIAATRIHWKYFFQFAAFTILISCAVSVSIHNYYVLWTCVGVNTFLLAFSLFVACVEYFQNDFLK